MQPPSDLNGVFMSILEIRKLRLRIFPLEELSWFVELNLSAVGLSVKLMVFLITGSLLHVYRLLWLLHAFIPVVTWALAPVNILK